MPSGPSPPPRPVRRSRREDLAATQDFFAARAAGWEERFPDDGPAYARAVDELGVAPGATVLDAGCGTGRALPPLRRAVGPAGRVLAVDATREMLVAARTAGREGADGGVLVQGDSLALPLADGTVDAVMAAGLLPHLVEPEAGLAELARVARPGGRLAVFHVIGRAALAARHGGVASDDDVLAPGPIRRLLATTDWLLVGLDDSDQRYLALAQRS